MRALVLMIILLLLGAGVLVAMMTREPSKDQQQQQLQEQPEKTVQFIHRWLENENETIATYIRENPDEDEDLVRGREALAETIGLLMFYALEINDQPLFNQYYNQLRNSFLEKDGFVNWKINEDGSSDVSTNAFIDDIRIMDALARADEKWGDNQYLGTAEKIGKYVTTYSVNENIYTDYYERNEEYASEKIQLSYIDVKAMDTLAEKQLLEGEIVANTSQVLLEAPVQNGFYPYAYNVEEGEYTFDQSVNMMNQAFIVYHLAQVGVRSEEFLAFIKQEMKDRDLIHGVYDLNTRKPFVDYESPAIYGYLVSYALILGEDELAEAIYNRMKEYQVADSNNEYYGGYSITEGNTHVFDNLIPLLAEQDMLNN